MNGDSILGRTFAAIYGDITQSTNMLKYYATINVKSHKAITSCPWAKSDYANDQVLGDICTLLVFTPKLGTYSTPTHVSLIHKRLGVAA